MYDTGSVAVAPPRPDDGLVFINLIKLNADVGDVGVGVLVFKSLLGLVALVRVLVIPSFLLA